MLKNLEGTKVSIADNFIQTKKEPFIEALTGLRFDAAYTFFFAVIIFCAARYHSPFQAFLGSRLLILLGDASYSFYLCHQQIISFHYKRLETTGDIGTYFYGVLVLGIAVLLALGAYKYVETPARHFLRKKLLPKGT